LLFVFLYLVYPNKVREYMLKALGDPGTNYAKFMEKYYASKRAKLLTRIELILPQPKTAAYESVDIADRLDDLLAVKTLEGLEEFISMLHRQKIIQPVCNIYRLISCSFGLW
jgi:hypothetical protein